MMMRITLLLVVALLGGADLSVAQEKVEARGITPVIKLDEVLFGHLTELNGKFKIELPSSRLCRAYLGVHHQTSDPGFDM